MTVAEVYYSINKLFVLGKWYFAYSALGAETKKSWDLAKAGLDAEGEELYFASLSGGTSFAFGSVPIGTNSSYNGSLGLDYKLIGDDQIKLAFSGKADSNGAYYYKNVPGFSALLDPLFGQFVLTGNAIKNSSVIQVQDIAKPDNVYVLFKQPVYWPYMD